MNNGANSVDIRAINTDTNETTNETVNFTYSAGNAPSENYTIDWSTADSIHDVAQVVDGEWTLMPNGTVRPYDVDTGTTAVLDYDRVVGIGDIGWTDYEVTVPITIHSIDPDPGAFGSPSFGPGVGFILRWQGHYQVDQEQPGYGWHQLGALGWFRWSAEDTVGLEMIGWSFGNYPGGGNVIDNNPTITPVFNQEMMMKMHVQSTPAGDKYRLKTWLSSQSEPAEWHMEGLVDDPARHLTGGMLLVSHHVDVSFGDVTVAPLSATRQTLNVTANGSGSVEKSPDEADYGFGEFVTVTAVPDAGYAFTGWSGDITSSDNPLVVEMLDDYSITANFEEVSAPISEDFNACTINPIWTFDSPLDDGSMVAVGQQLEINVPSGTSHDLHPSTNTNAIRVMQAAEDDDFQVEVKFDSVLNSSRNATLQGIIIEEDANDYIRFDFYTNGSTIRVFRVAVNNGVATNQLDTNVGTFHPYMRVTRSGNSWTLEYSLDGQNWTAHGTSFTNVMTVNQAGVFGGNASNNPAHTVLVDYFYNTGARGDGDLLSMDIGTTALPANGGSINVLTNNYQCGDTVTIEAVPSNNWQFTNWGGDVEGTTSPTTLIFDVGAEVTAEFKQEFDLTINVVGQGTVVPIPDTGGVYLDGNTVELTAVPDDEWSFFSWSGNQTDTSETIRITITEDTTITATFVEGQGQIFLPIIVNP